MKVFHGLFLLTATFSQLSYASEKIDISDFQSNTLSDWTSKSFSGETDYAIINENGDAILKADSYSSASGIAKEQVIDLKKTPYINWSWKIDHRLDGLSETTKDGDDYAARLYLVKDGGWKLWKTLALNYVWSSNQARQSTWNNAFVSDNAKMIAIQGKASSTSTWYTEKRDVYADMIARFGDKGSDDKNEKAYRYIDAVAIMTDTDNSKLSATAYYKDIYFSAE